MVRPNLAKSDASRSVPPTTLSPASVASLMLSISIDTVQEQMQAFVLTFLASVVVSVFSPLPGACAAGSHSGAL